MEKTYLFGYTAQRFDLHGCFMLFGSLFAYYRTDVHQPKKGAGEKANLDNVCDLSDCSVNSGCRGYVS